MADVESEILSNAQGPKSASGDAGSMSQHDLKSQIETDRYLKELDAASGRKIGFRLFKLIPPGAA